MMDTEAFREFKTGLTLLRDNYAIKALPHMRQRFYGVVVAQERQSSFEFTEGFRIHHQLTSPTAVRSDEKPGARRLQENRIFRRLGSSRAARSRIAPTSLVNHHEVVSHPARQRAEQRGTRLRVSFPSQYFLKLPAVLFGSY